MTNPNDHTNLLMMHKLGVLAAGWEDFGNQFVLLDEHDLPMLATKYADVLGPLTEQDWKRVGGTDKIDRDDALTQCVAYYAKALTVLWEIDKHGAAAADALRQMRQLEYLRDEVLQRLGWM